MSGGTLTVRIVQRDGDGGSEGSVRLTLLEIVQDIGLRRRGHPPSAAKSEVEARCRACATQPVNAL